VEANAAEAVPANAADDDDDRMVDDDDDDDDDAEADDVIMESERSETVPGEEDSDRSGGVPGASGARTEAARGEAGMVDDDDDDDDDEDDDDDVDRLVGPAASPSLDRRGNDDDERNASLTLAL
jgi:hypothetical protein